SEPADEIVADPLLINKTYKDSQAVADKLAPLLGISKLTTLALITKPNSQYVVLAPEVSTTTAARIAAIKIGGTTGINGINTEPTEHRAYPRGVEAGQVLGWAGADGHGDGLEYVFN